MKPLLIHGSTDKLRYDFAIAKAKAEDYFLISVDPKDILSSLFKSSVTSTLNEKKKLYFIEDADNLFFKEKKKEEKLSMLVDFITKSPHMFVLSTSSLYNTPNSLKAICNKEIVIAPTPEGPFPVIENIQTNVNRNELREYLAESPVEIAQVIHIIKKGAWGHLTVRDDVYKAIEVCFQKLYKYKHEYILSMVAYLIPPKCRLIGSSATPRPFVDNFKEYLKATRAIYPKLTEEEIRDIYLLLPTAKWERPVVKPKIEEKSKAIPLPKEEKKKTDLSRWI